MQANSYQLLFYTTSMWVRRFHLSDPKESMSEGGGSGRSERPAGLCLVYSLPGTIIYLCQSLPPTLSLPGLPSSELGKSSLSACSNFRQLKRSTFFFFFKYRRPFPHNWGAFHWEVAQGRKCWKCEVSHCPYPLWGQHLSASHLIFPRFEVCKRE